MPIVDSDWSINSSGDIRYTGDDHTGGSPSYATVLELHRFLQDLADDEAFVPATSDEIDITKETPSDRATDNIITLINNYNIDQTAAEHLYDGSISQNNGDDLWTGLVVVGSVPDGTQLLIISNNVHYSSASAPYWGATSSGAALNGDASANILLRTLVPVRSGGADIDNQALRVEAREFGDTYAEFSLTGGSGNVTAAIFTSADLNNTTAEADLSTELEFTEIVNDTEGYFSQDVDQNSTNENYYSEWDLNGHPINNLYEKAKFIQRRGTGETLYGLSGSLFRGITHQIDLNTAGTNSGTFSAVESVSWTGGTGQMLAIEDTTASGADTMWIQLLTGSAPGDGVLITGGTSGATATTAASNAATSRTVATPFIGASTGSAIIGAYGVGIQAEDLGASDLLIDLGNNAITPPNQVQFSVSGLVSGEDRVLVGPEDGSGALDKTQMTLQSTLSSDNITSIQMSATIPDNTPNSGTLRITTDGGLDVLVNYDSFSGDTFTISDGSADFASDNATAGNGAYVTYIDKLASASSESVTIVFQSNDTFFVRVRDGGGTPIRTFESTAGFTSGGGSSTAIRTSDA